MEQHVNKLGAMVEELDGIGVTILDEIKVMVLLTSLSKSYQYLIITLETLKPKDQTWDDVSTRLFNEKLMCQKRGDSSQTFEATLLVQKHFESNKNMKDRSKDICNYCKVTSHWDRNCM